MEEIKFKPIGIIHSSFKSYGNVPVQPKFSKLKGRIEVFEEFKDGLKDLEGFKYIICLSYFHLVKPPVRLQSRTHWDNIKHGIFAIRSPYRPNPIGFSVFKLEKIEKNFIYVENLDLIDGTPVLDIKPFIPSIDNRETDKIGWIKGKF